MGERVQKQKVLSIIAFNDKLILKIQNLSSSKLDMIFSFKKIIKFGIHTTNLLIMLVPPNKS